MSSGEQGRARPKARNDRLDSRTRMARMMIVAGVVLLAVATLLAIVAL